MLTRLLFQLLATIAYDKHPFVSGSPFAHGPRTPASPFLRGVMARKEDGLAAICSTATSPQSAGTSVSSVARPGPAIIAWRVCTRKRQDWVLRRNIWWAHCRRFHGHSPNRPKAPVADSAN